MNVIILTAIALIILVVLVLLITNAVSDTRSGTGCAALNDGACYALSGQSCSEYLSDSGMSSIGQKDCADGQTCCWRPFGNGEQ